MTSLSASLSKLFFVYLLHGVMLSAQDVTTNIGAIIDTNSRVGKEEKISMEIAIQKYNSQPSRSKHKLILHVSDSGGNPLQASNAAKKLIKEKQVEVITGMNTWREARVVSKVANRAQVPVLSFAAPSVNSQLTSLRWPFLVKMSGNDSSQIHCVASIVSFYGWQKVIAIYEEDDYNTSPEMLTVLSDALRVVGSEIEYWSAFPQFSSLSDPRSFIREEFGKVLNTKQSRVFIIIRSSLELANHILAEANHIGLMGQDSVWIATDSVTDLLDTVNSSVFSSMQGLIGVKTHFSKTSKSFLSFSRKFHNLFRSVYPEEDKAEPGIYALRAYDAISTIALASEKSLSTGVTSRTKPKLLLKNIRSSNFSGLTGKIQFENEELSSLVTYEVINVVRRNYVVLKLWSLNNGFSDKIIEERSGQKRNATAGTIDIVYWPGALDRVPLGWKMANNAQQMVIGVPGSAKFKEFVKVRNGEEPTGFSIDVFTRAVGLLNYELPYRFESFNGSYDDLVNQVYDKRYDAVVGDITILANRSNYVEFTQPYAESGLTMIVPVKPDNKKLLFLRPFTFETWLVVGVVFVYTMFVVWFMERRSNSEFKGPWRAQLSTSSWFIFSTLFFAHKEPLRSNFTRVVVVVWLFFVFVITACYNASLTSILTVQSLEATVTDMETLKSSNSSVGCDFDSFVRKYMIDVLEFLPDNLVSIDSESDFPEALRSGRIKAAFLELPYERALNSKYCKNFKKVGPTYRFGGLGFAFPKGSLLAKEFSKAFLNLSEDGILDDLNKHWFPSSHECSNDNSDNDIHSESLKLRNIWSIFVVTGLTSTIMLILYIVQLYMKSCQRSSRDDFSEHNTPGH